MVGRRRGSLALALVACGSEHAIEPARLGEVCGVEDRFQTLALAVGEYVFPTSLTRRVLYAKYTPDAANDEFRGALWSSEPCGEDPKLLTDDYYGTLSLDRWPDLLLVCREQAGDIVSLDPAGVLPPHVVFTGGDCQTRPTAHGLLQLGESLILHPYPDDPRSETSEPVVLVDRLDGVTAFQIRDELAFMLFADGTLSRVDLPDGAVTVEQTGVRRVSSSPDGRYLLTQKRGGSGVDQVSYEEPIVFTDRSAGQGTLLLRTDLARSFGREFAAVDQGIFTVTLATQVVRLYFLPGLESVDLPFGIFLHTPLADGRWLFNSLLDHSLHVGDPHDPATIVPIFAEADVVAVDPDGVRALNMVPEPYGGHVTDESPLWFVPFDGSQARRLADRMTRYPRLLADGRYLTLLDVDEQRVGDLVLVDPETREERLIDRRVRNYGVLDPLGEDVVWYAIAEGEDTGVWLARLPAE